MDRIYNLKNYHSLTINDVHKLEEISNKKFDLGQRLLLVDLGNTQQVLEVINRTESIVRVIKQTEEKNIIKRKSCIISSTNDILAFTNSKIYCEKIPLQIVSEIRECKKGIGKILLYHRLDTFKKITEIGYAEGLHIYKKYSLYHKGNIICKITETFPFKINKSIKKQ